jgi:NAD(P)-dependent dehydrogenase (short-subunit alcohol dehydrogenase family)
MERLNGKVAIVTGGAHGIGRVLSLGLADEGASVVVPDIDEQAAQQLASEMTQAGKQCLALPVDVTSEESTVAMARRTLERFGRIDILLTCAAIYATLKRKEFLEIEPEEWDQVLSVNLTGAQLCARAVLPAMKEQRSGAIINMGSVNTYLAPEGRAHYSAGKAALENLTKTLAREMGPFGIRVNTLCPGLVRTGRAAVPEERYQRTAEERALRRELLPTDLVGPLVFLCSDDASMVTGHTLVVDGGQIFQ